MFYDVDLLHIWSWSGEPISNSAGNSLRFIKYMLQEVFEARIFCTYGGDAHKN